MIIDSEMDAVVFSIDPDLGCVAIVCVVEAGCVDLAGDDSDDLCGFGVFNLCGPPVPTAIVLLLANAKKYGVAVLGDIFRSCG